MVIKKTSSKGRRKTEALNMAKAKSKGAVKPKSKPKAEAHPQLEVAKVGWNNENPNIPIVLISKKLRQDLQIDKGSPVKVGKGDKEMLAIVQIQFKELVGKDGICTLNTKLAYELEAKLGDKVTLNKQVTESEFADFQANSVPSMQSFLGMIA